MNKTNRIIFGTLVAMTVFFAINSIGNNSVFAKHHSHNDTDDMVQSAESNDDNSKIIVATINDSAPDNNSDCKVSKKDCLILDDAISDIQDIVKNFNNAYPGMK